MSRRLPLVAVLIAGCATEPLPSGEDDDALYRCSAQPSVQQNTPLAGGVNEYQGFPLIAGDPHTPQHLVAAAVSGLAPGNGGRTVGPAGGQAGRDNPRPATA